MMPLTRREWLKPRERNKKLEFKSIIGKFLRFFRNPQPYFDVLPYKFFGNIKVIRFYRKYILPVLVWRIRRKKLINVVFLAMNPDMWKYGDVYRKLAADKRFNPIVVTAMRNIPNMEIRLHEQEIMISYFETKGFNVIRGYNFEEKKWIELGRLKPDIIFHTQPYDGIIDHSLEYYNHLEALHCYTPYSFQYDEVDWEWNNTLQQYCWKVFYVNESNLGLCKKYSRIGCANAVASGYCFEEEYADSGKDRKLADEAWHNDSRKRIIWAPHHSIGENEMFKVSSFLEVADLMVTLRDEYKDKIVFAFKPHPVLQTKLYNVWGRERTNAYYQDWASADNSFDAQGDYKALFAGSDAMIHCSGSFIVEYLYTAKPVAYVYSKTRNPPDMGLIGTAALEAHYPMHSPTDIRRFIDDVVLGGHDTMIDVRKSVADKYLMSPNGKMFSENVYETIVEGLGKK